MAFCHAATAQVTVETVDGRTATGQLSAIDSNGLLTGEGLGGIPLQQVLSIQFEGARSIPDNSEGSVITTIDGGTFRVTDPTIDGESILFSSVAGIESVAMQSARSLVFREAPGLTELIQSAVNENDLVIVESGNGLAKADGLLQSMDQQFVWLDYKAKGKVRKIKRSKVVAIVVADLDLPKVSGSLARLSLGGNNIVAGGIRAITDNRISVELTGGQVLQVDRSLVSRVDIDAEGIRWLASMDPADAVLQPQFTIQKSWQRNRSIDGNPLRLMVAVPGVAEPTIKKFNSGIGTKSYSRLVFANENGFTRFLATAGIDMETEGRGDCVMRVEGDGISLWSARIRGGEAAIQINVNIEGISRVALIVEPGEQFDLADHANWANARFLKSE